MSIEFYTAPAIDNPVISFGPANHSARRANILCIYFPFDMKIHDGGILRIAERCYIVVPAMIRNLSGLIVQGYGMTVPIKNTFKRRVMIYFAVINEFCDRDVGHQSYILPLVACLPVGKILNEGIPLALARNRVRVFQCTATREFIGISRKGCKGQQGREYDTYLFHLASSTFLPPRT